MKESSVMILMAVRGDELIGFTKAAAEAICKEWGL